MSGTMRSEDNDDRPQRMTADPERYYDEAWERSKEQVLAEQAGHKPDTLGPNIVGMSLRGEPQDVERLVAAMREMGIVVWRRDTAGTRAGNQAGYRYFSVEVPPEAGGG